MDQGVVNYAEVRQCVRWLQLFSAVELADALGVDHSIGERFIRALLWHGICEPTGDHIYNGAGPTPILRYKPVPPGPREHWTDVPPEVRVGYTEVLTPRGVTQRLVDNTDRRNLMQGTDGSRARIKRRDAAYEAMQRAKAERTRKNREKAARRQREQLGKKKRSSVPVTA